jgi:hypothetical protein
MKFLRTTFPKRQKNSKHDGAYMLRFGKSCCISFCEFWGFLPCYYDPVANKINYRPSIRWILLLIVSTVIKVATFYKFMYNYFTGKFVLNHRTATRIFMLKLNLFTGFVHLHTAWKCEEICTMANRMSHGF